MPEREAEKPETKHRILLVPLDWGLGHTTRCIPIIKEFLANNCDLWLAGDETQQLIFKSEFPTLNYLFLPGYRISYSKSGNMVWKMMVQLPKIFKAVKKENEWLEKIVKEYKFDAMISDNRFGLYSNSITSVFITHQLQIKTALGKKIEKILQRINYRYINRFTECWIPDVADEENLAGKLSHPVTKPKIPVHYLGLLSRFENDVRYSNTTPGHLLIILSGPEPQRSILENKIIKEIAHYPATATVVRGLPASLNQIPSTGMIKFYNYLPSHELQQEIQNAEWVISRCGYSTVMDMLKLKKKSILVPTPGQTEQEYLAEHLSKKQLAFCISQREFSLHDALQQASGFDFKFFSSQENQLAKIVKEFLGRLKK